MNRPSPALYIAFVLSFSSCTCEYHTGTSASYGTSGGDQVVVYQDPNADLNARIARDRAEREARRQRERDANPRWSGAGNEPMHVRARPAERVQGVPSYNVNPPASGQASAPSYGGGGTAVGGQVPATPAPMPSTPIVQPTPVAPTPAPVVVTPSAPAVPPSDSYVGARSPESRPGVSGAGSVGAPASNNKAPVRRAPMTRGQ